MDSATAVLAVLSRLQSVGFCAGIRIPGEVAASDPSEAFDAVLAGFLREAHASGREARPLPAALGDGRRVDLLRLFLAVRAAGGYGRVPSAPGGGGWAAAAESAGLDPALAAPVKVVYAKYLGALDRWIQRLAEAHGPFLDGGTGNGDVFLSCNERGKQHVTSKRKLEDMVGMLGWVRELAENALNGDAVAAGSAEGHLSTVLAVREAVSRKRARRASMANGALLQEFPVSCKCCMSSISAQVDAKEKCTGKLQLLAHHPDSDINELTTGTQDLNHSLVLIEQESQWPERGKHESCKKHNSSDSWLFTSHQRNKIPVGCDYQAQVPQWTGELPVNYDGPETLKWLGTKVWPQANENCKAFFGCDPIGKGREAFCACNLPGSVECVRFHVAERRLKLKRELGYAFYLWGFDRMGEEVALSWTAEEEANFKAVAQLNAPSSGRNIWNRLQLFFKSKGRKELVSYYFNCFLLRRRCYQNRITPTKIDSDDEEETEFRFLGNRLGHCAAKYDNMNRRICLQNTHCMDLDR
ncbi:hypothetical protein ACP4OV_029039 [Aristida adscensionis]